MNKITFHKNWCKGCGICVSACPKNVYTMGAHHQPEIKAPDQCVGCKLCEMRCPDFALEIDAEVKSNG